MPQRTYRENPDHPDPIPPPLPPWLNPQVVAQFRKKHDNNTDAVFDHFETAMDVAKSAAAKARAAHVAIMQDPLQTELANLKRSRTTTFKMIEPALRAFDSSLKNAREEIKNLETAMTPKAPAIASEIRSAIAHMKPEERAQMLSTCDDETAGAVLAAPAFLSGMSEIEQKNFTAMYRLRRFPNERDRIERYGKAIETIDRAGKSC